MGGPGAGAGRVVELVAALGSTGVAGARGGPSQPEHGHGLTPSICLCHKPDITAEEDCTFEALTNVKPLSGREKHSGQPLSPKNPADLNSAHRFCPPTRQPPPHRNDWGTSLSAINPFELVNKIGRAS